MHMISILMLIVCGAVHNVKMHNDKTMASKSTSTSDPISITVSVSTKGGDKETTLNNISLSTTVGEVKSKLNVKPNSRFGRSNQFENWDNRRPLSDYFVKNGESFDCVIQCNMEEGQSAFDDYNEWLSANKN
ncbi:hypothetical protein I4U23_017325 [Adineta vaga]|nr:hypothetical protein I4U23_017325 [Adineta vaga]